MKFPDSWQKILWAKQRFATSAFYLSELLMEDWRETAKEGRKGEGRKKKKKTTAITIKWL